MNAVWTIILSAVTKAVINMGLAALSEKVLVSTAFKFLHWVASWTHTPLDDSIVKEWEKAYYDNKNGVASPDEKTPEPMQ